MSVCTASKGGKEATNLNKCLKFVISVRADSH